MILVPEKLSSRLSCLKTMGICNVGMRGVLPHVDAFFILYVLRAREVQLNDHNTLPSPLLSRNAFSGETIIQEGDADRSMFKFYIVEEGEARAYILEDGEEVLMSHLGPGTKTKHMFSPK